MELQKNILSTKVQQLRDTVERNLKEDEITAYVCAPMVTDKIAYKIV
jgi:hypothetical protein